MTVGEVLLAVQWQQDEERRLQRIAAPWEKIAEDIGRGSIRPSGGKDWRR